MQSSEAKTKEVQLFVRQALALKKEEFLIDAEAELSNSLDDSDDDGASFDARMRQQILRKQKELGYPPPMPKSWNGI